MARDDLSRASSTRPRSCLRPDGRAARRPAAPSPSPHALTMAEYFRDREEPGRAAVRRQHLPLRPGRVRGLSRPCSGRMPSAVGYQPTLAAEMGDLQERITSTKGRSITSLQAVYVPADDYTDPARPSPPSPTSTPPPSSPARSPRSGHLPGRRPVRRRRSTIFSRRRSSESVTMPGRPTGVKRDPPAVPASSRTSCRHPRPRRALRGGPPVTVAARLKIQRVPLPAVLRG